MIDLIRSLVASVLAAADLRAEDGGVGGLILAVVIVIAIIVIALFEWVF
jgi:hypothetical protein